jgi:hypothetical protein
LILDGQVSGLFPENKNNSAETTLRQKETEYQWGYLPAPENRLRQTGLK